MTVGAALAGATCRRRPERLAALDPEHAGIGERVVLQGARLLAEIAVAGTPAVHLMGRLGQRRAGKADDQAEDGEPHRG